MHSSRIERKDKSFVEHLWNKCYLLKLVTSAVNLLTKKPDPRTGTVSLTWYFQALTLPYFTTLSDCYAIHILEVGMSNSFLSTNLR